MEKFINFLTELAQDVHELKAWKSEQDTRQKEAQAEAEATQKEFEKFIKQRKSEEAKRAADEEALRKMMI